MKYVISLTTCIPEYVTQPNRCLTLLPVSTDTTQRYEASTGLTTETRVHAQVCPISYDTSFAPTLEIH